MPMKLSTFDDYKRRILRVLVFYSAASGKPPTVQEVSLESFAEGLCCQTLHVGPYDQEGKTVAAMTAHAVANGVRLHGRHHEIYLSD